MTSLRQIEANRRNAQLSTGPVTDEGKRKSRQNALRHGLTAETVIDALEDAEDYAAFEMAVAADYDAQSAVERELVLRLASLLWRLRRATAIESRLFKTQATHLLQFRRRREAHDDRQKIIESMYNENQLPQAEDELARCRWGRDRDLHAPSPCTRLPERNGELSISCAYRKLKPERSGDEAVQEGVWTYDAGSLNRPRDRRIFV